MQEGGADINYDFQLISQLLGSRSAIDVIN